MKKFHNKTLGIVFLVMLATAPLSISYSFAEDSQFESEQKTTKSTDNRQKRGLGAILTEKVVDGKLEVKRFALPENLSEEDMKRIISVKGETSGWAYVKQKAYQSGIILFDGKAFKVGQNFWELSSEGTFKISNKTFNLDLKEKSNDSAGIQFPEDLSYKVIFSGKMVEAGSETFAVILTNSGLKNPESAQNTKLDHTMEFITNPHANSNQGFGKMI